MKLAILGMTFLISSAPPCLAQEWQYAVNQYGVRSITASLKADCMGTVLPVKMRISCQPAKRGFIGFEFTIQGVDKVSKFHFDEFEGPDAPGGDLELRAVTSTSSTAFHLCPNGGYGPSNAEDFTFSAQAPTDKPGSAPKRALRSLAKPGTKLVVIITDPKSPLQKLSIEISERFPKVELQKLLEGIK